MPSERRRNAACNIKQCLSINDLELKNVSGLLTASHISMHYDPEVKDIVNPNENKKEKEQRSALLEIFENSDLKMMNKESLELISGRNKLLFSVNNEYSEIRRDTLVHLKQEQEGILENKCYELNANTPLTVQSTYQTMKKLEEATRELYTLEPMIIETVEESCDYREHSALSQRDKANQNELDRCKGKWNLVMVNDLCVQGGALEFSEDDEGCDPKIIHLHRRYSEKDPVQVIGSVQITDGHRMKWTSVEGIKPKHDYKFGPGIEKETIVKIKSLFSDNGDTFLHDKYDYDSTLILAIQKNHLLFSRNDNLFLFKRNNQDMHKTKLTFKK